MGLLLFIDTSTRNCSVALAENGILLGTEAALDTMSHAKVLHAMIKSLLAKVKKSMEDLNAVVVAGGPGSYTGLRIGMSAAKGICFAKDIPFIVVDTLAAYADAMYQKVKNDSAYYIATLDSRKGEIYFAIYQGDGTVIEKAQPAVVEEIDWNKYDKNEIYIAGKTDIKLKNIKLELQSADLNVDYLAENYIKIGFKRFNSLDFDNLIYKEPNYLKPFQ